MKLSNLSWRYWVPFLGVTLLVAAVVFAGTRERVSDEWTRSYPIEPGGRIEIVNVNGSIEATPASGSKVEIVAQRVARAGSVESARELLAGTQMIEAVDASRVRLEVKPGSPRGDVEVRVSVRVPKGVAVDLRTSNGAVVAAQLDSAVSAATTNGGVRATGLASHEVTASAVNGTVEVSLAQPLAAADRVAISTTNGRATLELPSASLASVHARVRNGAIDVDDAGLEWEVKSRTRVQGTLNGGGAQVKIDAHNGAVEVTTS